MQLLHFMGISEGNVPKLAVIFKDFSSLLICLPVQCDHVNRAQKFKAILPNTNGLQTHGNTKRIIILIFEDTI